MIAIDMAVAVAGLGATAHRPAPEVALPLAGPVEVPSTPPRVIPVAQPGPAPAKATVKAARVSANRSVPSPTPAPSAAATRTTRSNATALVRWRAALADRNNHPADVVVVGDSITEGYFVTDADRWITRLRDDLRAAYPTSTHGGEGFIPAWHVGRALDHGVDAWTQRWTLSNFPQDWTDSGYGLGRRALVFSDARQSASISVTADRAWLAYTEGPDEGLVRITVDNKLPVLLDTNANATRSGRVWDSGPLGAGNHTFTVAAVPGSQAVLDGIMPFVGDGGGGPDQGRGVRVWEGGHSKYTTEEFAQSSFWAQGFDTISPDLVIIELGTNDDYFGRSLDQVRANVVRIVDTIRQQAKAAARPVPSIAVMPVWARGDRTVAEWQRYRAALLAAADDRGLAVLDAFAELNQAPATPTTSGLFMDVIHPNPAGHRWLGDMITRLLAA
ncbi:MAG TPA: GDSL-type esterase/lipase family protein [Acidimicrobiales bacterium]|nr:GDSL-type esterase/lipase family protein [Acidimicrobiales bacterium]